VGPSEVITLTGVRCGPILLRVTKMGSKAGLMTACGERVRPSSGTGRFSGRILLGPET
jgi:hypothetical protein